MPDEPQIAVIDDDESIRLSLEGLIRSLGYTARIFASAEDFLASPALERCACIISDIQMPGLSGLDLLDTIRARRITTPFIFVTAYGDEKTQRRGMSAGAICFLKKPFDAAALVDCLTRALGAPRA